MVLTNDNPFQHSSPANPGRFFGRETDLAQLFRQSRGLNPTRLSAPRRYGKTSLLFKLEEQLKKEKDTLFIYINLFGVNTKEEVLARFKEGYVEYVPEKIYKRVFKDLDKVSRGKSRESGVNTHLVFKGGRSENREAYSLQTEESLLLNGPQLVQKAAKKKCVVALDEFQDIFDIKGMDRVIRSRFEKHDDNVNYVFAGSHKTLLEKLFTDKTRAFYGQALPLYLKPVDNVEMSDYIREQFRETRIELTNEPELISEFAMGHPHRAILISYYLWELLALKQMPSAADAETRVVKAIEYALELLDPELETEWRSFNTSEQKTLKKILVTEGSPYAETPLNETITIPGSTLAQKITKLKAKDIIRKENADLVFYDPFLALWMKQQFFDYAP